MRLLDLIRPRLGLVAEDPYPTLLDDALRAFQGDGWLTIWTLRDRLEAAHPDMYGEWMADDLRTALREHGITAVRSAVVGEDNVLRETLGVSWDAIRTARSR